MSKKAPRRKVEKKQAPAKRKRWSANRSAAHKTNGSVSEPLAVAPEPDEKVTIGEAMRQAVEALGEVIVDDQVAPQQMRQLGDCYEEITKRQAAYDAQAEKAKTAKKSLESAQELLLLKVREFTHPTPLPLFDHTQAESDRDDMLACGDVEEIGQAH